MDTMTTLYRLNCFVRIITVCVITLFSFSTYSSSSNAESEGTSAHLPFFSADYEALIQGFPASAKREHKPLTSTISELSFSATSMLASLKEISQFSWQRQQIKPIRFTHELKLLGQSRRKTLSFNWNSNQITSTSKGKTNIIENPQEALDHLSFQLQLQHDLTSNQIEDKIYRIADKKKIKEYRFKVIGEERIETKLGALNTTKVVVIRDNDDRVTYIWLARDWSNLLARLEQYEEKDKKFSIQITSAFIGGKKVSGL
jgi:hypothetical protein